ncbi:hypothetical protein TrST_g6403, partial [Triparma strigata]
MNDHQPTLDDALAEVAYLKSSLNDSIRLNQVLKAQVLSLRRDMVLNKQQPDLSFTAMEQQDLAEAFMGLPVKISDLDPGSSIAACEGRTGVVADPAVKQGKVKIKLDADEERGSKSITISVNVSKVDLSEKAGGARARKKATNTRASKMMQRASMRGILLESSKSPPSSPKTAAPASAPPSVPDASASPRTLQRQSTIELSEDEVMPLTEDTVNNLINLTGFNMSKNRLDEIAWVHLSKGLLGKEKYKSFEKTSIQETSDAKDLDELFDEAKGVLPVFEQTMRDVVEAVGLMPSDLVMVDDRPLHGRDTVLSLAPLKGRERTIAKVKDDYEGNHLCVLDLVRCSIIVETEMQVAKVLEKMLSMDIVVRLKNRIRPPLFTGMRHLLLNVGIGGHICEVQIHQAHIFDEKHVMNTYFDYFRAMFQGSSASYEQLMVQVEAVGNLGMKR